MNVPDMDIKNRSMRDLDVENLSLYDEKMQCKVCVNT